MSICFPHYNNTRTTYPIVYDYQLHNGNGSPYLLNREVTLFQFQFDTLGFYYKLKVNLFSIRFMRNLKESIKCDYQPHSPLHLCQFPVIISHGCSKATIYLFNGITIYNPTTVLCWLIISLTLRISCHSAAKPLNY